MKKPSRTYLRKKADRLFSELIRSRGYCEKCGLTTSLQTSHIISRRYLAVRYDEDNAQALCARDHLYFSEHPVEFVMFLYSTIGKAKYEELQQRALAGGRPDYVQIIARLQESLEAVA